MDWGMIGHEWAVSLLSGHVAMGRERHAYLITGPPGVGRRTLALRFAQGLNCPHPPAPGKPCRICSTCKRIEQMQHPDLSVVAAEYEGATLKIEQVRALQHTLSLAPYEARYRIALILRFEEAHPSAANAMLKTLEEPPARVVVMLTARSAESLMPTITSRCEVIRLRGLSLEETATGLQSARGVEAELSERLAHISDGRPGIAIRMIEQPRLLETRQGWLEDLTRLMAASRRERFAYAKEMVDEKDRLQGELQVWLTFWRDVLIRTAGMDRSITNLDYATVVEKVADSIEIRQAQQQVSAVERTIDQLDRNVNARLAVEVLVMDFPKINISG